MPGKPVYLDYNATTPLDPAVSEAMLPFLNEKFGNPSSAHYYGIQTKQAVEYARKQVAALLGAGIDEIVFTSGGSESNNYAIKGAAEALRNRGNHIITSAIEHPAVTEVCKYLENKGFKVTYLPVDDKGLLHPAQVEEAITPQTILISVMHANNEVGTIQPIREIAGIAHRHGIIVHTDAAQSVGKIPVNVGDLDVDLLSVAGHKLYAPKGIGALYIRTGIRLAKQMHGADHERNLRAGTENVLEIAGLGKACALISENLDAYKQHMEKMRDRLEAALLETVPDIRINGHREKRLPNTASIAFRGLEANTILSELTDVAASAGAACHSDQVDVSHVLEAMQVPLEFAMGTIRFSVGRFTTIDEIDKAAGDIREVVSRLQPKSAPVYLDTTAEEIRLTRYTHGLGCACKLRPQLLEEVLKKLPPIDNPSVLVGTETSDDAAVYRLNDESAVVQTVDFFTPIVDDPYFFGAIAAANSLSDIYAMGARPLFALNIVGFPGNRLPLSVLEKILKGAQDKAREAGVAIIGGHTVEDTEPKFGLAVTGMVHPDKILRNRGAKPGDVLILTKPIGSGILSTALKQGMLRSDTTGILMESLAALNRHAAEAALQCRAHAATDITGFGLLGHLLEMVTDSDVSVILRSEQIPLLPEVFELAAANVVPGGSRDNMAYTGENVHYSSDISQTIRLILNDAQTSGGLLLAIPGAQQNIFMDRMAQHKLQPAIIGKVTEKQPDFRIRVD